ncbi:MAG: NUDIX domain-containing protein [Anaerolineaceae bacterium]|nr:NUDIX domain-containing protein [Anaerolineaceae bacterium]
MPQYEESYLGQLRKDVGKRKLIAISARAIVRDQQGNILFVRRSDNGDWVMPAGSIELGESILECVKREVKEETGLNVISAIPMAIYSDPRFSFITSYGDPYQMFTVVFLVDQWSGILLSETDETVDANFFDQENLPSIPDLYSETLSDLKEFKGQLILK